MVTETVKELVPTDTVVENSTNGLPFNASLCKREGQKFAFTLLRNDMTLRLRHRDNFVMDSWLQDSTRVGSFVLGFAEMYSTDRTSFRMSEGALKVLKTENAGGNSEWSEAFSYEVMHTLFNGQLEKTEMEIEYFPAGGSITDYQILIRDVSYGVSVTRGFRYRAQFTDRDARVLLEKKLTGVLEATRLVMKKWKNQILHVLVEEEYIADVLERVFRALPDEVKGSTLVFVTVVKNAHWIMKQ